MPERRPIVLALLIHNERILVGAFLDTFTGHTCYRPLGGGINPGEEPEAAMRREMMEELGAEITSLTLHSTFDNHFFFRGEWKDELVHIFTVELADNTFYQEDLNFLVLDTTLDDPEFARWIPIEFFRDRNVRLFPEGLLGRVEVRSEK